MYDLRSMNSKCQVDLIDMQSQANDQYYKFILACQDDITKRIQLRPLKSKITEEVAYVFSDIFPINFWYASDNGR